MPQNYYFEKVDIDAGSGEINILNIKTRQFDLEVGAGNTNISNILVEQKTDIDGGAGKVVVIDSSLNNLDLDIGIGAFQILNTQLLGKSDIDSGVGKLEIILKGGLNNYKIIPERGMGSFTIQGNEVENYRTYGEGTNQIKIEAGVGKVDVNFVN